MRVQNVQVKDTTLVFVKKLKKIKRLKMKLIMRLLLEKTLLCKLIQIRNLFCYKPQKWKFLIVMKIGGLPVEFCLTHVANVPTAQIIYEKL